LDQATAIAVDGNGNVVVTGESAGSAGNADYATIKYSGAGVPLWTNRYNGPGNDYDGAWAVAVDGSGNVLVTGESIGSNFFSDITTIKYSSVGVGLWTNRYNGPAEDYDYGQAIAADNNGNVFVTGVSWAADFLRLRDRSLPSTGVLLWDKFYSGAADTDDAATAMALDVNGSSLPEQIGVL
jgi:hypothetical protein